MEEEENEQADGASREMMRGAGKENVWGEEGGNPIDTGVRMRTGLFVGGPRHRASRGSTVMEAERWRPQGRRGPEAGCRGQPCAAGLAPTRALETSVAHGSADVGQPLDGVWGPGTGCPSSVSLSRHQVTNERTPEVTRSRGAWPTWRSKVGLDQQMSLEFQSQICGLLLVFFGCATDTIAESGHAAIGTSSPITTHLQEKSTQVATPNVASSTVLGLVL